MGSTNPTASLTASAASAASAAKSATAPAASPGIRQAQERLGLWLGLAGVLMFAVTIPMTRLAGGTMADPQLPPAFVAVGRAMVAGLCSLVYLVATHAPWPRRAHRGLLPIGAAGVVFGFPLMMGFAVRHVDAVHASVITGVLPLATAAVGAVWLRQRPSIGFWLCALAGCALVIGYALLRGGGALNAGDLLLLGAVAWGAVGYVAGARLVDRGLTAEQVICWMLVLCLPITAPLSAWIAWDNAQALVTVRPSAWVGFAYVSLISMWIGFFAWYRGLALGGTLRVSQVQLIQPFAAMLAAVPLLGERLDALTVGFALAVIATVLIGKRMPARSESQPA